MAKQSSIKPVDLERYSHLTLHEIEAIVLKLERNLTAQTKPELRAARQALHKRQRIVKSQAMAFEQTNDHHLLFFDSTSNFCKIAGHSVLFFTMTIADRIHWRYSVKIDSDHYSVSEDGIISFRSLENLSNLLAGIGIFPDTELSTEELHYYRLAKVYTPEQIAKLRDHTQRDTERMMSIIMPSSPLPLLYDAIAQVNYIIYYQFKHLSDSLARDTIGRRIILESYELMVQYLEFANSHNDLVTERSLAKIIELSRRLRHGMAYAGRIQILRHRQICQMLEHLVVIDRIASKAYQKAKSNRNNVTNHH